MRGRHPKQRKKNKDITQIFQTVMLKMQTTTNTTKVKYLVHETVEDSS